MHILSSISSIWIGPWLPCSPHFTPSIPSLTVQPPNAPLPGFSHFRSLAEVVFFSHDDDAFHLCIQCDDFRFCPQIHLLNEALIQLSPQGILHQRSHCISVLSSHLKQQQSVCEGRIFVPSYITFQRKQWHPTPVHLPRKSHGRRSLVGCSPWGP